MIFKQTTLDETEAFENIEMEISNNLIELNLLASELERFMLTLDAEENQAQFYMGCCDFNVFQKVYILKDKIELISEFFEIYIDSNPDKLINKFEKRINDLKTIYQHFRRS